MRQVIWVAVSLVIFSSLVTDSQSHSLLQHRRTEGKMDEEILWKIKRQSHRSSVQLGKTATTGSGLKTKNRMQLYCFCLFFKSVLHKHEMTDQLFKDLQGSQGDTQCELRDRENYHENECHLITHDNIIQSI